MAESRSAIGRHLRFISVILLGCGPPAAWPGTAWVDRVTDEHVVLIVSGREVVVPRGALPSGLAEGDFVRNGKIVPSRRRLSEQLAREAMTKLANE